ncbi:Fatty acyl-CoA reductase [Gemmata sp. SH-PL17]|uniref:SDR family oxidoreductase n=1 Tax=Gemmata sp. SH-PL17 TaxID=1630693 RepID=UPI00078C8988|nr:SDR family oxidoreductase [Gemmata sp. SH-PL17]AMV23339.1 Fatty acyl-CoA reductase [Gemmata sp. SH-PL17]
MSTKLKKIQDQVVVVTGASSGIGLATVELLAEKGASVVLAARSGNTLNEVVARITTKGGKAVAVSCDVTDRAQVEKLAASTVEKYGRIDTWVNNAGLGVYARADADQDADARRIFDVNFWGAVYGCQVALPHLKSGGALITVGSEVSDASAPLMAMYVASKHAIKGYVDVLRLEVEDVDKLPVAVTLIQPTAVDTPFPQHAANHLDREPKLPDPMIEPKDVAEAILHAAEHPTREKKVGAMSVVGTTLAKLLPGVLDTMAAGRTGDMMSDEPPRNPAGALRQSSEVIGTAGRTHGTKEPKKGS